MGIMYSYYAGLPGSGLPSERSRWKTIRKVSSRTFEGSGYSFFAGEETVLSGINVQTPSPNPDPNPDPKQTRHRPEPQVARRL